MPAGRHTIRRDSLDVAMTPMIDVVFLLLVFFVWTTSFQVLEHVLPGTAAETAASAQAAADAPPPEVSDLHEIVVRVLWDGNQAGWQLNHRPLASLAEVERQLAAVRQVAAEAPVIIHPDSDTPLGDIIDAYDASRRAGFPTVQFAVSP